MKRGIATLAIAAVILAAVGAGAWLIWPMHPERDRPPADATPTIDAPPAQATLTALPDAETARLRAVRDAIENGEQGLAWELREKIERVAPMLSDDELIAALELVVDPNYAIETLCGDEAFPLERKIKLLRHFVELQDAEGMDDSIAGTAYQFSKLDPAATREWLRIFEPGVGSGQGYGAIFDQLDKTDPAASVAMFCDLDDREAEAIIGYGNGPDLKHLGGRGFLELTESFRSEKLREFHLRQTVVWHLAEDDPEDALAYIRALPSEDRQVTHGRHLIQILARAEDANFPDLIRRMTSDLPVEVRSPETFSVLAAAWYGKSPSDAFAWLGTLDAGASRDAAVSGYLSDSMRADPAGAYALAQTIDDVTERQKTTAWALRVWADSDADAVRALLPDADIPDDLRDDIGRKLKSLTKQE